MRRWRETRDSERAQEICIEYQERVVTLMCQRFQGTCDEIEMLLDWLSLIRSETLRRFHDRMCNRPFLIIVRDRITVILDALDLSDHIKALADIKLGIDMACYLKPCAEL
jgi:hypothetical protein